MVFLIVALIAGGAYYFSHQSTPSYQFITVTRGSIAEKVSVTGNVSPTQSVSLGFGNGGTIAHVYSAIGKIVRKGDVLAELNTNDLYAQLQQARANMSTQQAKLEGLKAGARPEDVAASQAAVDKAHQDLLNMYAGIIDTSLDSYSKANDAVRVQLDPFFTNADSSQPQLTYITSNSQFENDARAQRLSVTAALNKWQTQLSADDGSINSRDVLLNNGLTYLSTVRQLLNSVSKTLDSAPVLTPATLATYKASVTGALTEVNTASKNLNTINQNVASQKVLISQLQAQLDLKKAGTSAEDIDAQQAQVQSAQAAVQSAEAKLQNSQIVAPITGVITQFDAKLGQLTTSGTTLISIISDATFEVDAVISETDIGKIALNNKVVMTLDAFPNESFSGTVFYVDPGQTSSQGVVGYKIKISFDNNDPRIKSGLTCNAAIETRRKENALIVPQYAILQNDQGTFVETLEQGNVIKQIPVTLGLEDQSGNVEIVSGVTEGEQVLNIGLKHK